MKVNYRCRPFTYTGDSTDTAKFKVLENTPKGPQLMVVDKVESG